MRRPAISAATKIWVPNDYWSLYSQCCTWRPEGGVDVWECIRPRTEHCRMSTRYPRLFRSLITSYHQPPNSLYWQYLGRR
ncbi:hypothetical protein F5J12DRAFT_716328 [Pisolithus orientalis]|uniref:uncharacterized protein n=1 Tax=Pisolithus orientalis TaxID=936130 RepID=UPI002224A71E|nr:uncharacterized protein F5J12DRAFT_716328 [Pisolithus orientalis]KAI6019920.1 hypothetical protein F5J12DRAFT_716328 [Pisolithus orientalis]